VVKLRPKEIKALSLLAVNYTMTYVFLLFVEENERLKIILFRATCLNNCLWTGLCLVHIVSVRSLLSSINSVFLEISCY
jgi:hypothetical protein